MKIHLHLVGHNQGGQNNGYGGCRRLGIQIPEVKKNNVMRFNAVGHVKRKLPATFLRSLSGVAG